jgi:1,4-alpha-glucan branching enzyme
MKHKKILSIVLNGHHPFPGSSARRPGFIPEEAGFFQALSETYLPLIEMLIRLESSQVPFRLGLVLSPILCCMLQNEELLGRYLEYLDKKIEFGMWELNRRAGGDEQALVKYYYEADVERRILFTERCEMNLLRVFDQFQKKGRLEILTTAATYAFLPFYASIPEVIHAQIETALISHRRIFGRSPQGFWLPEFGWSESLEAYLSAYGFSYTLIDAHGLILGSPPAERGIFCGAKAPGGLVFLGRDYPAARDLLSLRGSGPREGAGPVYQEHFLDTGFELPPGDLEPFLCDSGERCPTGYRYHSIKEPGLLYDPRKARNKAAEDARLFLDMRLSRLREAEQSLDGDVLSLCAFDADEFGRFWYEGTAFLEELIREVSNNEELELQSPQDYLDYRNPRDFQTLVPEFSSWGVNGYAETWLDASNDWMYRHIFRSVRRMIEMTSRFPNDTGLKERALNQAAREILLALGSDWPKMLALGINSEYARDQIEDALRNYTTIYESLGSNYISTEWLTVLEKRHPIFPFINYRIFAKKK